MIYRLSLLLLLVATALGFDGQRALETVRTIASDEFQGRRPGFPGGQRAEQVVAELLKSYGVQPAGVGGYFQPVPMLVTEEQDAELTIMNHELGKIPCQLGADFTVVTHSGSGGFIAPVVIAGYGYVRPDKDRDDYGDLDCRGAVVLIVRGKPDSPWDFEEDFPRRHTLEWAKQHGAAAVMWYAEGSLVNGAAIPASEYDPQFPLMYVSDRMVRLLLDGSPYNFNMYLEKLKRGPLPIATGHDVWIRTQTRKLPRAEGRNVVGIVYGTDPVLKNELIVIGAHLDHIGANARGVNYNGADDNASGSAVVCELARVFAEQPLKRSVLVLLFTGEEAGLLGSEYFAANPTIPFGNVACMLNFDMEGQGDGTVGMAGGELLGKSWRDYVASLDSSDMDSLKLHRTDGDGSSDYASFLKGGAPAISFWSDGRHPFYHRYTDDPEWISAGCLQAVGDRAVDLMRFIGDTSQPLAFHSDSLAICARLTQVVDFKGFSIDQHGSVPEFIETAAAWLPSESAVATAELLRRTYEFEHGAEERHVVADGLAEAVAASSRHKPGAFVSIAESGLTGRKPSEVKALIEQGLSVVQLAPSSSRNASIELPDGMEAARAAGITSLIPFDFATPARVEKWGKQGMIVAAFSEVADAPGDVRDGVLRSDAFVFLELSAVPTAAQLEAIAPFQARQVHLSFAGIRPSARESTAKQAILTMHEAGIDRAGILRLTGGNLRRYLAARAAQSGQGHD
ncbi:M28 family peptidase [candidate division KSB1 bacterium]|nr:M28 family peptidase [candidate division KSB1 bacterium]